MNLIQSIAVNKNYPLFAGQSKQRNNTAVLFAQGADTFTRTTAGISFKGQNRNDTSNGRFLKGLEGIADPYSGVTILTFDQMQDISKELNQKPNTRAKVAYLKKYESSMLPVERNIFRLFEFETGQDKFTDFSEILQRQKPFSMNQLRKEQIAVLDKIEEASANMSPKNRKKVAAELKEGRQRIYKDDDKHPFKRKAFINKLIKHQCEEILDKTEKEILSKRKFDGLAELAEATERFQTEQLEHAKDGKTPVDLIIDLKHKYLPDYNDEYKDIINIARKLPTSNTSIHAFVIKYADRSNKEIGERLLNQSVATIEHIDADSLGGENEAANFMLTTKARNEARGNLPIRAFIKMYPGIPKYSLKYMNDIINSIHKGKLKGYEWYPYLLKDKLAENGITVDISNYKIPQQKAFRTLPPRLHDKYPNYQKYIPEKGEPLNLRY